MSNARIGGKFVYHFVAHRAGGTHGLTMVGGTLRAHNAVQAATAFCRICPQAGEWKLQLIRDEHWLSVRTVKVPDNAEVAS